MVWRHSTKQVHVRGCTVVRAAFDVTRMRRKWSNPQFHQPCLICREETARKEDDVSEEIAVHGLDLQQGISICDVRVSGKRTKTGCKTAISLREGAEWYLAIAVSAPGRPRYNVDSPLRRVAKDKFDVMDMRC